MHTAAGTHSQWFLSNGGLAEWLNAAVLKTAEG